MRSASLALLLLLAVRPAAAQDSLRLVRFTPTTDASRAEVVILTFDRPVAPRLGESVDPVRAARVIPDRPRHTYWRTPSTIIIEFDTLWAPGARYRVLLDSGLRAAGGGAPLVRAALEHAIDVAPVRAVGVIESEVGTPSDTILRPMGVYDGPVTLARAGGWAMTDGGLACGGAPQRIALLPRTVRRLTGRDTYHLQAVGMERRDRRLDSLRHVVELVAERPLPRGCSGRLFLRRDADGAPESAATVEGRFAVRQPFGLSVTCHGWLTACARGGVYLRFNQPVTAEQVRAHVRVDGRAMTVDDDDTRSDRLVLPVVLPVSRHVVEIDAALRAENGDRLGHDERIELRGAPAPRGVGLEAGSVVVSRRGGVLLPIRYAGVDTVIVVVARVAEPARATALAHQQVDYRREPSWGSLISDSVVLRHAVTRSDTEAVLVVRANELPAAWQAAPLLAVRARGTWAAVSADSGQMRGARGQSATPIRVVADGGTPRFVVVRRTDVAIHTWQAVGVVRAWVTRLKDARPRRGMRVRLLDGRGFELAQGTTDSIGLAVLPMTLRDTSAAGRQLVVEARDGMDVALERVDALVREDTDEDEPESWRYGNAGYELRSIHGAAFAERGIYRPGEQVFLRGIVRTHDAASGFTPAAGDSARWRVTTNGRGEADEVWTRALRLGDFGTTADTFAIPRTARLGEYQATLMVRHDGRWRSAGGTSFAVAEYRVPEFGVVASADSSVARYPGDSVRVTASGRYLFGMPMDGAPVTWWARVSRNDPWGHPVRGLEGFQTERGWWAREESSDPPAISGTALATGADGTVSFPVPVPPVTGPSHMEIEVAVTDANRQTIASKTTVPVRASAVTVGVRFPVPRWRFEPGQPIAAEVAVVDSAGARVAGVPLTLLVIRRRWRGRVEIDTVFRDTLRSSAGVVSLAWTPAQAGSFELMVEARDARGRPARAGLDAWVYGGYPFASQRELELRFDRERYAPGDRAMLRVQSPVEGTAMLSVHEEGALAQRLVRLERGVTMLPVTVPDGAVRQIAVTLTLPLPAVAGDTATPLLAGDATMTVTPGARRLVVALAPDRDRYRPGERVRLALRVRDATGRPVRAEATVWAVDQGVASLTQLEAPDLTELLRRESGSDWSVSSMLRFLQDSLPPGISAQFGYDRVMLRGFGNSALHLDQAVVTATAAAPGAPALRQRFSTTPLYAGAVRTGADGRATVEFDLPDNLTTFRLFAAAVDAGVSAGVADTAIVSSRTLAVRAALPRVVREGDTLLAGAVITRDADGLSPVSLRAEGRGVRFTDGVVRTDTLRGRRASELRFGMVALGGDSAVLRFAGTSGADGDAVEARLPVSPSGHSQARVVMGTLAGSADVAFALDRDVDLARSRLELQLGSSPLPMLQRLAASLELYPWYCTEQLTSAGRALVARIRAERLATGDTALAPRDRRRLETAVAILVGRQREDGGIGYWGSTNWTSVWLSTYALGFLDDARSLGIAVPPRTLADLRAFVQPHAPTSLGRWTPVRGDTIVYAHELLAAATELRRLGHPDTLLERRLIAPANQYDWVDRLAIARLLAARGDSAHARAIVADAWRATRVEGRRVVIDDSVAPRFWLFRSIVRPAATLVTTAALLTPDDARLQPLFESMLQIGRSTSLRWNTLDQALLAEAALALMQRPGGRATTTVRVSGAGRELATTSVGLARSDTVRAAAAALVRPEDETRATIALRASSPAPVYFAATLHELPKQRPVGTVEEGIRVERWYERYDEQRPIVSAREGELVRVRIRVTVPADREFVAVEDALPAGLEAVDLSLRTSSLPPFEGAPRLGAQEGAEGPLGQRYLYGAWDGRWWSPWEHREIRDDRVVYFARQLWTGSYLVSYVARATTAGIFVRPPAHAEEMYNPAVHGRSDGGVFTVEPTSR